VFSKYASIGGTTSDVAKRSVYTVPFMSPNRSGNKPSFLGPLRPGLRHRLAPLALLPCGHARTDLLRHGAGAHTAGLLQPDLPQVDPATELSPSKKKIVKFLKLRFMAAWSCNPKKRVRGRTAIVTSAYRPSDVVVIGLVCNPARKTKFLGFFPKKRSMCSTKGKWKKKKKQKRKGRNTKNSSSYWGLAANS